MVSIPRFGDLADGRAGRGRDAALADDRRERRAHRRGTLALRLLHSKATGWFSFETIGHDPKIRTQRPKDTYPLRDFPKSPLLQNDA